MKIKTILNEDFSNYKKPSMFIGTSRCTFKCDKECGVQVCQNSVLAHAPDIEIDNTELTYRYLKNHLTSSLIIGGLEPIDTFDDLINFLTVFRRYTMDMVVIYTGYEKEEISRKVEILSLFPNIIMKFGRFLPGHKKHYDNILGVYLASDNQYAERIS